MTSRTPLLARVRSEKLGFAEKDAGAGMHFQSASQKRPSRLLDFARKLPYRHSDHPHSVLLA